MVTGRRDTVKVAASLVLLLFVAGASAGCGDSKISADKPSNPVVTPVSAATVSPDADVVASGPLLVENQVDVSAQREGIVARIVAETGTVVKKGQLLGELDPGQALADRDAVAAKVKSLEYDVKGWEYESKVLQVDYERAQKMWAAQLITQEQLDHARYKVESDRYETERYRANLDSAREQLKGAEIELAKTRIVAPFAGVVGRRYVRVGEKVSIGQRLFWVTETAPLRVRFTLPERYVNKVHLGDMVNITVADVPDTKHQGKIVILSPVVDPASGTIEVAAEVVPPVGDLRPGMSANISLARVNRVGSK
jgi:RND family efflux transporter MFP subunit